MTLTNSIKEMLPQSGYSICSYYPIGKFETPTSTAQPIFALQYMYVLSTLDIDGLHQVDDLIKQIRRFSVDHHFYLLFKGSPLAVHDVKGLSICGADFCEFSLAPQCNMLLDYFRTSIGLPLNKRI
eukprot:TRINITY_DN94358_c0_g1_i1.p2 TRINITY_DN94358_c0_g1~~TRINITY_DN94358_c0_g1_i1.p2  ORF type:complete len:126 (-),score=3.37 TRINITY_DN94358_c0_g1_i1:677-1054(-)